MSNAVHNVPVPPENVKLFLHGPLANAGLVQIVGHLARHDQNQGEFSRQAAKFAKALRTRGRKKASEFDLAFFQGLDGHSHQLCVSMSSVCENLLSLPFFPCSIPYSFFANLAAWREPSSSLPTALGMSAGRADQLSEQARKRHTSFLLSVASVFSVVRLGGAATFQAYSDLFG